MMAKKPMPGIVDIKGKQYKTVALRVHEFREKHSVDDGWAITCDLVECSPDQVIVKATIADPTGRVVAADYAQERWQGQINTTSAVENCSTSAIGRALAAVGLAGQEYASANEVQGAIAQQDKGHSNKPQKPRQTPKKAPARAPEPQASDNGWLGKARARLSESAQDMGVIEGLVDQIGRSRDDAPDAGTWHACLSECNKYMSETKGFSTSEITRISARIHSILGTLPTTEEQSHDVF